jgi:DNA (cytosine-5)-methyltransferase 1
VKFKLLDLYCCQGGAAKGYAASGLFDVVGVDIEPQPRYPFDFIQADALDYLAQHGRDYDFIHASPPCQKYTRARKLQGNEHHDFIPDTRNLIQLTGKPFVIENVPGAPLRNPVELCGTMFGLKTYRHRLFESNFLIKTPAHIDHEEPSVKMGRPVKEGQFVHIVGHFSGVPLAREIMGMPWANQYGLAQAIPPAYIRSGSRNSGRPPPTPRSRHRRN